MGIFEYIKAQKYKVVDVRSTAAIVANVVKPAVIIPVPTDPQAKYYAIIQAIIFTGLIGKPQEKAHAENFLNQLFARYIQSVTSEGGMTLAFAPTIREYDEFNDTYVRLDIYGNAFDEFCAKYLPQINPATQALVPANNQIIKFFAKCLANRVKEPKLAEYLIGNNINLIEYEEDLSKGFDLREFTLPRDKLDIKVQACADGNFNILVFRDQIQKAPLQTQAINPADAEATPAVPSRPAPPPPPPSRPAPPPPPPSRPAPPPPPPSRPAPPPPPPSRSAPPPPGIRKSTTTGPAPAASEPTEAEKRATLQKLAGHAARSASTVIKDPATAAAAAQALAEEQRVRDERAAAVERERLDIEAAEAAELERQRAAARDIEAARVEQERRDREAAEAVRVEQERRDIEAARLAEAARRHRSTSSISLADPAKLAPRSSRRKAITGAISRGLVVAGTTLTSSFAKLRSKKKVTFAGVYFSDYAAEISRDFPPTAPNSITGGGSTKFYVKKVARNELVVHSNSTPDGSFKPIMRVNPSKSSAPKDRGLLFSLEPTAVTDAAMFMFASIEKLLQKPAYTSKKMHMAIYDFDDEHQVEKFLLAFHTVLLRGKSATQIDELNKKLVIDFNNSSTGIEDTRAKQIFNDIIEGRTRAVVDQSVKDIFKQHMRPRRDSTSSTLS